MKDIGTQDEPLRFVGEELQLDVYDGNDPVDTGTRRWWYRTDLSVNESDAVLRVNNNGEIVDVPVYEESTPVESGINTSFGIVAPGLSEPAFVPMVDPADAAFDFARVEQPGGSELALHNRLEPGSAIPDSVVTRYTFEDDSDTTTAIDAVGSNDATLNGGSFSTDSAVGDFAWSQDGTGDYAVSNSTVDLSASGSTVGASVGARLKPSKTGSFQVAVYWGGGSGSRTYLALGISDSDEWQASIFSGEGTFESVRGGSVSTTAYKEVFVASDNTDLWIIEDGSEVARITISNGADLTALGAQNLGLSRNADLDNQYYGGLTDNPSYIDKAIEASQSDGAV